MSQETHSSPPCGCCHCRVCLEAKANREDAARTSGEEPDYWILARRPLACLVFLVPLLMIYEVGAIYVGSEKAAQIRNGADVWLRNLLGAMGVPFGFLLPVLVVVVLLGWHLWVRQPWKVSGETLMGMFAESLLFAFVLIVAGQMQNLAFEKLGNPEIPLAFRGPAAKPNDLPGGETAARAITFVGAGVYEEVLFRLCLLPVLFGTFRLLQLNKTWAAVMAVISTSLMFSLAHHIGPTGEAFRLFPFTFRLVAGLFFAGLFVVRGFGITVGTHAAYDLLVGLLLTPSA